MEAKKLCRLNNFKPCYSATGNCKYCLTFNLSANKQATINLQKLSLEEVKGKSK